MCGQWLDAYVCPRSAGLSGRQLRSVGLGLGLKDGAGAFCCACRALAAAMRHRHGDLRRAFAILAASLRALLATLVAWEQAAWSDRHRAGPVTASEHSGPNPSGSGERHLTCCLAHHCRVGRNTPACIQREMR